MRKRVVVPAVLLVAVIAFAVGLYLFQPWRIFTSSTVIEDIPAVATPAATPDVGSQEPSATPTAAPSAVAVPRELASGQLISHEHASSGTVKILELPDGSRILRFEGLDTSDGPDLRVWLTDAPVIEGLAGWQVFDDGAYLDLGALKANKGDQNYDIPAATVLGDYTSVSIWCARFTVSFAAAELNT
ncbi:DM13 domain-containing protein [Pseudarthrobacter sp. R1]|uniref:DM13 domain-containing protein n=1 Tax=Pseudarthrobacter sp. R1 TaxID=2944934 RepID=UPI00210EF671|nr:DM13 domain-containing protein [Pseudarthrobacter sp. R1]MCQ6269081.1 DM13 domain-containing protein [Pseudarthrobacter sp. R1]